MEISGKTKLIGLFGSPIEHSKSPEMYNYCFKRLNIDNCYMAFDIKIKDVDVVAPIIKNLNMVGANITMPLKGEMLAYMDKLSPAAELIGAVNLIENKKGRLIGHNTDGVGFLKNLERSSISIKDKKITILGAGGAGTAIQVQAALDGAREISIFNRRDIFFKKAELKAKKIEKITKANINVYDIQDIERLKMEVETSDLFINSTPLGMKGNEDQDFLSGLFREDLIVADVVYNPSMTKFLKVAEEEGCRKIFTGSGMLLNQGAETFKILTGYDMPLEEVRERYFKN